MCMMMLTEMLQILLVGLIYLPSLSLQEVDNPQTETLDIPVKRLLSRHRRFIAPGTRWDWLVGWETVSENFCIQVLILVKPHK